MPETVCASGDNAVFVGDSAVAFRLLAGHGHGIEAPGGEGKAAAQPVGAGLA